jgi:hypothetical protein
MISDIKSQFTSEYIANVLWKREIAKVSSITLIPQIKNEEISYIAYIDIDSFCDTEVAYDFVCHMSADNFAFCHNESDMENTDNFWIVEKNTHNSGNLHVGSYTTAFMPDFFEQEIVQACAGSEFYRTELNYDDESDSLHTDLDEEGEWHKVPEITISFSEKLQQHRNEESSNLEESEEFRRNRPIKGLGNNYYSVDEALTHLWVINKNLDNEYRFSEHLKLEQEHEHFERELRIHEAVNKSSNVTLRAYQLSKGLTIGQLSPSLFSDDMTVDEVDV